MSRYLCNRRGSLLLEVFSSLLIYSIIVILLVSVLQLIARNERKEYTYLVMASMQVQELLATCEIIEIEVDRLKILCNKEEYVLEEHNERFVKRPTYQIMMSYVKDLKFSLENEVIWMEGKYHEEEFKLPIAKREWWR